MCKATPNAPAVSRGTMVNLQEMSPLWPAPPKRVTGQLIVLLSVLVSCMGEKGGEGVPQSKKGTADWYRGQVDEGGFPWFSHAWARALIVNGVTGWFRWVFLQVKDHPPTCRWRRFCEWV